MAPKNVTRIVESEHFLEGAGFPVRRPIGGRQLDHYGAFLLLDHFGPIEWKPNEAVGAPWHPHRGFSTISYIIQGESAHQDSMGNSGILRAGDVQWMKAGSGVVHDEVPTEEFKRTGGVVEGFQIWVNLPAAQKMTPPSYQDVACDDIPTVALPGDAGQIKVIAGSARGVDGATQHEQEIHYVDIHLNAGHSIVHAVPEGLVGWAYVYRGTIAVGSHNAQEGQLLLLSPEGTDLDIASVGSEQAKVIVLAAAPIDEPVARRGPFVMNTEEEVMQAFKDYRDGTLASVPAKFLHRTGHESVKSQ